MPAPVAELLDEGYPGARQSEIGYFSTVNNYEKYLDPKLVKEVYGGEGRDGGSLADRAERVPARSPAGRARATRRPSSPASTRSCANRPPSNGCRSIPPARSWPIYRELRSRGVKVTTASGATSVTVAHSTLGAVIALNRRFPLLADAQRRHAWELRLGDRLPRDLKGQCAAIVGLGPIGRTLASLLRMLGMTVIGVHRSTAPVEAVRSARSPTPTCSTCFPRPTG